jgi:predicted enzyme related to lactoylglutathione lyase
MADSLKMVLSIDTRAAKESLKLIRDYFSDLRNLLKDPEEYELATKEAEGKLDSLEAQMDALSDVEVSIDADSSGAESAAGDAESAIEEVPEEHHTQFGGDGGGLDGIIGQLRDGFDGLTGSLAQYGLALSGVVQAYGMLKGAMGGLVSASNQQEMAETRLTASLQQRGMAAEGYINQLKSLASEVQGVTTIGDEASLELMNTAIQMGIGFDDMQESLTGAIGLTKAFSGAGLTMETAIKGIALAQEGEYSQLQRYIPALRSAQTETEKMTILKEAMANGFELAKAEAESGAGALEQYQNAVGDLYELLGSLIKGVLIPLVKSLKTAVEWIQKNKEIIVALGASVVAYMGYLVLLNLKLVILTAQQVAYNVAAAVGNALMGNYAGIALAAAAAAGVYLVSTKKSTDAVNDAKGAVDEHNKTLEMQAGKLREARAEVEAYVRSMDYAEAKEELRDLRQELEKLDAERPGIAVPGMKIEDFDSEAFDAQMAKIEEYRQKRVDLGMKIGAYEEEIRSRDLDAVKAFYAEKERLETEASLSGQELSRYRLERAEAEYNALGKLDAGNVERKKQLYAQIVQYRKEVADAEEAIAAEAEAKKDRDDEKALAEAKSKLEQRKLDMVQHYANLSELSAINYDEMEAEFERYLGEVSKLYGEDSDEYRRAQSELSNIQNATHMRMIQEKGTFVSRIAAMERDKNKQILADRERLLEEAKRLYGEESEAYAHYAEIITRHSAEKALKRYADTEESLAEQLAVVEEYFEAHREMLIEAGYTEEQIVQAQEDAKARIRKNAMQKRLAEEQQLANGVSGIYGNLSKAITGESKKSFETRKALAIVQGMIDTYSAALAAYASMAKFGPVLAAVAAAAAVAAGLANVDNIRKQEYEPPKAADGGLLKGHSHAEGGTIIEAEGGEFVTKKSRVQELGAGLFNFLNSAPLEQVREALGGMKIPEIPTPTLPKAVYADGGMVSNSSGVLIQEIRWLRKDLQEKEFVNEVYINPDKVIENADDILINSKNVSGAIRRGGTHV